MPVVYQKHICRADLRANSTSLYVFGDNEARFGDRGQAAEMRGEPNAHGIPTLRAPGRYWSDADARRQNEVVNDNLQVVRRWLLDGRIVVWPLDGIGTGFACLKDNAPQTWACLQEQLARLGINNPC